MIVRQQPRTSALMRVMDPDTAAWGLSEHLLAVIADAGLTANWQRGRGKKSDRPKPIPRPGIGPEKKVLKGDVLPVQEMGNWLGGDFAGLLEV